MNFFEELQRRKVYRVAAASIIAAGFIIQIGSAIFPAWELPNWTFRLVVVLLLIGFPIALILAPPSTSLQKEFERQGKRNRNATSSQHYQSCCDRRDRFGSRRFFPLATGLRSQRRQVNRSATLRKSEWRSR